ncbi:SCP domain-containing protein [Caenorhabditis elegans]|uniref:SCP domain-containing protein n=1 Tax=Caenorhabditis elegans TaxID=6239 RepID=Q9XXP4_CAEEL|nr:SCP domain-containing protein [Caenorhabditis elegans]CAA16500.1 SCP domain-containing protein [Caenorhabditis elegans]|eukprot:NP_507429.1 SCP-Like extracellular protein [Caenorhabditis elegans]
MKLIILLLALTAAAHAERHFNPQHQWNAEAIDNIVFIHNKLRNAASHGLWERYSISKSSNMQLLSWNESLVAEVENEKYYCEPADNKNLPIKLGDNIYQYDVNTYDDIDGVGAMGSINKDTHNALKSEEKATKNRLRQMLYSKSKSIGCIYESCDKIDSKGINYNTRLVICKYSPPLENIDEQLFDKGEPCSNCPSGTSCGTDPNEMMKLCK